MKKACLVENIKSLLLQKRKNIRKMVSGALLLLFSKDRSKLTTYREVNFDDVKSYQCKGGLPSQRNRNS